MKWARSRPLVRSQQKRKYSNAGDGDTTAVTTMPPKRTVRRKRLEISMAACKSLRVRQQSRRPDRTYTSEEIGFRDKLGHDEIPCRFGMSLGLIVRYPGFAEPLGIAECIKCKGHNHLR